MYIRDSDSTKRPVFSPFQIVQTPILPSLGHFLGDVATSTFLDPNRFHYPGEGLVQAPFNLAYILAQQLELQPLFLQAHSVCKQLGCADIFEAIFLQYGRHLPTAWAHRDEIQSFLLAFSNLSLDLASYHPEACFGLQQLLQKLKDIKAPIHLYVSLVNTWKGFHQELPYHFLITWIPQETPALVSNFFSWTLTGHFLSAKYALQLACQPQDDYLRTIGKLALSQDPLFGKILLLAESLKEANIVPSGLRSNYFYKLNQSGRIYLFNRIMTHLLGHDGLPILDNWLHVWQSLERPNVAREDRLATFLLLNSDKQRLFLSILSKSLQKEDRLYALQITTIYPSLSFLNKLIERQDLSSIFQEAHYSLNLSDILELHAFLENRCSLKAPSWSIERLPIKEKDVFIDELKQEDPMIQETLDLLSTDHPELATQLSDKLFAWGRLGMRSDLIDLLITYPFNLQADKDTLVKDLQLLIRLLQLGIEGWKQLASDISELSRNDLRRLVLMHHELFEKPILIAGLLDLDIEDPIECHLIHALIKDPKDPWNLGLLHLARHDLLSTLQQDQQLTFLKDLASQHRYHLTLQLARSPETIYPAYLNALALSPSLSPEEFSSWVQHRTEGYIQTTQPLLSSSLKDDPINVECCQETASAIALARTIFHGTEHLHVTRLQLAKQFLNQPENANDSLQHMRHVIEALLDHPDLRDQFSYPDVSRLSPLGTHLIQTLLRLPENTSISWQDIQVTVLSALLCRSRQVLDESNCFAIFHTIYLQSSPEGLERLLNDYYEILRTGELIIGRPDESQVILSASVSKDDLFHNGLAITHPLSRAKDLVLAKASTYIKKPAIHLEELLLKPNSLLQQAARDLGASHSATREWIYLFFEQLHQNIYYLADLQQLSPSKTASGKAYWQLIWKGSQEPIQSWESYLALYQASLKAIPSTLMGYSGNPQKDAFYQELIAFLSRYFIPGNLESSQLFNALIGQGQSPDSLWFDKAGGFSDHSLSTYYFQKDLPFFERAFYSAEHFAYDLLMHVHQTYSPSQSPMDKIPLDVKRHTCNLLPNQIYPFLETDGSPKEALFKLIHALRVVENTLLDLSAQKTLIDHLQTHLVDFFSPEYLAFFKNKLLENTLSPNTTAEVFAQQLVKQFALCIPNFFEHLDDFYDCVDVTFFKYLHESPLAIFADTNWAHTGHQNIFLAFGWSLSQQRLGVFDLSYDREHLRSFSINFKSKFTLYTKLTLIN